MTGMFTFFLASGTVFFLSARAVFQKLSRNPVSVITKKTAMSVPQPEETGGFSLIVTVTIQPDKYDEWLRHSWETFKLVTAEPDCLSFEMFSVPGEPNKVKWVESWGKSLEAVMAVSSFPFLLVDHLLFGGLKHDRPATQFARFHHQRGRQAVRMRSR